MRAMRMDTTATHWERAPQAAPAPRKYSRASDRQWGHFASFARLYIIVAAGMTLAEGLLTPESLNWMALQLAGPGWRVAVAVALVVHALLLLDAVVNDWLPASITMRSTWNVRHLLLLVVAVSQMIMGWLVASYLPHAWVVMSRIGFDGAAACGLAVFDVVYRHRLSGGVP